MAALNTGLFSNLQSTVDYAYPNTRVMAWKGDLLKEEDLRGLASAKHLEEYVGLLEHTSYKKVMSRLTTLDINSVEQMLILNMIETHSTILNIAPENTYEFFDSLVILYEKELIKLVLNNFDGKGARIEIKPEIYESVLDPAMRKFLKDASDAKSRDEALNLLKATEYSFIPSLPDSETRDSGCVASYLDRYYFMRIWDAAGGLSGKDAGHARSIIGKSIDMNNIMVLMRSAVKGFDAKRFIVPVDYGLKGQLNQLPGKNMREMMSILSDTAYEPMVEEGVKSYEETKSLLAMEMVLRKHLLDGFRRLFGGGHSHIGILLGFLKLKEYELRNLRSIAVSIDNELSVKDIMELVVT